MRILRCGVLILAGAVLATVCGGCSPAFYDDGDVIVIGDPIPVPRPHPCPLPPPTTEEPEDPQPSESPPRRTPIDRPRGDTTTVTKTHETQPTLVADTPRAKPVSDDRRPDRTVTADRDDEERTGRGGGIRSR